MLSIVQVLIIFPLVQRLSCTSTSNLYREAERRAEEKRRDYAKLKELYFVDPSDYDIAFNVEQTSPSLENVKAQNLVEYQHLFKEYEYQYCKRRTFLECVNKSARKVAAENKCLPLLGKCDRNAKYAPIGGYCNNLKHPNYGRHNTPYVHTYLDAGYKDGISSIRKDLPSPRFIGNVLANQYVPFDKQEALNNFIALMFGQFIVHDTGDRKVYSIEGNGSPGVQCCKKNYEGPLNKNQQNPNCVPVEIPPDDPFFAESGIRCQNYRRMMPTLDIDCKIEYLVENEISAYLDLTIIYSDFEDKLKSLRTGSNGQLRIDFGILPVTSSGRFTAGDGRVGQTPMLALIHSIFYRFHNKIAKNLAVVNKHWDDNKLFFESRRIVIAIYQKIVYNDWLPRFISPEICVAYNLICEKERGCEKYDININPSVTVEFSHSAFRSCHRNIPSNVTFLKANYKDTYQLPISDTLGKAGILKEDGKYEDLVRGMLETKIVVDRPGYSQELRNKLFKVQYKGREMGNDLHLIDMMRNRDSGAAPFIRYFEKVHRTKRVTRWEDIRPYFNEVQFDLLRQIYENVEDIDLLTGLILEPRTRRREIGSICGEIIAEQFRRLKYGDRFFYLNPNNPHSFDPDQMQQIKDYTFAKLLCFVVGITKVPQNAFVSPSEKNPYVLCKYLNQLDFNVFKA